MAATKRGSSSECCKWYYRIWDISLQLRLDNRNHRATHVITLMPLTSRTLYYYRGWCSMLQYYFFLPYAVNIYINTSCSTFECTTVFYIRSCTSWCDKNLLFCAINEFLATRPPSQCSHRCSTYQLCEPHQPTSHPVFQPHRLGPPLLIVLTMFPLIYFQNPHPRRTIPIG